MKIGIFSKLGASGGSEHRCAELANAISRFTNHTATIFCEDNINDKIRAKVDNNVNIIKYLFSNNYSGSKILYEMDTLLIINSDSYSFTKLEYWEGKLKDDNGELKHSNYIDVSRIPQMVFLFNFVISPAQDLYNIAKKCNDVRIITANLDFYYQFRYKSKFDKVKKLPITILESPINPDDITPHKSKSNRIRIGKHSKAYGYKHNREIATVIRLVNAKYQDIVQWDFMGVPDDCIAEITMPNVIIRPEYSVPVREYLRNIDIFMFFIKWERSEPWARAVGEAMMAGCPILTTDKGGNRDQVYNGLNGYLCQNRYDFVDKIGYLIEHRDVAEMMRQNNIICSKEFTPDKIATKLLKFME